MHPDDPNPSERVKFWGGVLRREHRALFTAAMAWCGEQMDAEDLVQDTLVQLARTPRSVNEPLAYAIRTMRNRYRNHLKRTGLHREVAMSIRATVFEHEPADDRIEYLLDFFERLPDDQQEIITLRTRCQLSLPQIALVLDTPIGTVSSRYSRAITALREVLSERGHHD